MFTSQRCAPRGETAFVTLMWVLVYVQTSMGAAHNVVFDEGLDRLLHTREECVRISDVNSRTCLASSTSIRRWTFSRPSSMPCPQLSTRLLGRMPPLRSYALASRFRHASMRCCLRTHAPGCTRALRKNLVWNPRGACGVACTRVPSV